MTELRRVRRRHVALRAHRGRGPLDAARRARRASTRCCWSFLRVKTAVELRAAFAARELSPVEIDRRRRRARRARRVHHAHARAARASRPSAAEQAYARRHRAPAGRADARGQGPLRHRGRAHDLRLEASSPATCPSADADAVARRARTPARSSSARRSRTSSRGASRASTRTSRRAATRTTPSASRAARSGGSAVALATGAGGARARHRHRRLDPHPGRVLRRLRPEADLRPDHADGVYPARPLARPRRPDGAHARRRAGCSSRRSTGAARTAEPAHADRGLPRPARAPARARHPARVRRRRRRALDVVEVAFERRRAHLPDLRADPERPRPRSTHAAALPGAPRRVRRRTSPARLEHARDGHARRVHRGDRRARAHPRGVRALFAAADLLLTPIAARPAGAARAAGPQGFRDGVLPYTVPQDLAGLPTCAVPVGFDDLGLPVGVQLTGPPRSEGRVLAAAEALFSATASARAGSASDP